MSNPYRSSSASGSSSPPSETPSNNTSPPNVSAPLWQSKSSDEADSHSTHSRETPNRMPVDLPRASLTGRGGCWCASFLPRPFHLLTHPFQFPIVGHVASEERYVSTQINPFMPLDHACYNRNVTNNERPTPVIPVNA